MTRILLLTILVAVVAAGVSGAVASRLGSGYFKTPSGKIVCGWGTGGKLAAFIECGVSTGLKPPIPKAGHSECAHLNYVGNRVGLATHGRVQLLPCVGDAGPFADPGHTLYLGYGKSWRGGGIVCTEATSGLTCRNRDGHGFFLSLGGWRTF